MNEQYVTPAYLRRMDAESEYWRRALASEREAREIRRKRRLLALVLLSLFILIGAAQLQMSTLLAVGLRVLEAAVLVASVLLVWNVVKVADEESKGRR